MASEIRVDTSKNASGLCTVTYSNTGAVLSGITTGTFSGDITGDITGNVTGNISGGTVAGSTGTFTGDVDIADKIVHTGDTDTAIRFPSSNQISFETTGSEGVRIDGGGRLLVGTDTARTFGGSVYAHLQLEGTTQQGSQFTVTRNTNDTYSPNISLVKTRGTSDGAVTTVQDNDVLGTIQFRGADGSDVYAVAADINAEVDGSPSDGTDMPGALRFGTTAEGAASPTERLRISSDGRTLINTTAVTNTHDTLTVKRASGSFTEMSMTVDASTAVGSYCNSFIFTKSKGTYWNGYGFQSSHGHIGAIVGKRDSGGGDSDQEIRIEIGGTHINQSEEKTWNFKNNGNLSISDGNLVVAHGHGIDFSANTNDEGGAGSISADGEILDDYEEGSWTPVADGGGTINGTSITYSGYYTKVGRLVTIEFYANNSQGDINIPSYKIFSGLPFATGSGHYGTGRVMTEDGEQLDRQGDIIVGGSAFLINKCGDGSGTVRLSGTVTYIAS